MLRSALKALERNEDVAHAHGMVALGYEQCGLLDAAEAAARRALDLRRKEPWAQHALAHVMLTCGRIDEGSHFLESASLTWSGLNSFMSTHLWWHLALFYLSQGRNSRALHIYDTHCWGVAKSYSGRAGARHRAAVPHHALRVRAGPRRMRADSTRREHPDPPRRA